MFGDDNDDDDDDEVCNKISVTRNDFLEYLFQKLFTEIIINVKPQVRIQIPQTSTVVQHSKKVLLLWNNEGSECGKFIGDLKEKLIKAKFDVEFATLDDEKLENRSWDVVVDVSFRQHSTESFESVNSSIASAVISRILVEDGLYFTMSAISDILSACTETRDIFLASIDSSANSEWIIHTEKDITLGPFTCRLTCGNAYRLINNSNCT